MPGRTKSRIRQDDGVRLTFEERAALKDIMTGREKVTTYSGREYLSELEAKIDEPVRSR